VATVVFLVLAVIWAAVLIPPVIRRRTELQANDSIGDFRKRLGILQRTSPQTVEPAFRLEQSNSYAPSSPINNANYQRHVSQKRRRDILVSLAALSISTLVLGLIPAFHMIMWVGLFSMGLLVAYIALLVRMKNRAMERKQKLRAFPSHNYNDESYVTDIRSAQVQ
jgi:hypothetical protein